MKKPKHSHNHKPKQKKSQNNGIKKDKEVVVEVDGTKELHVTLSPKTPVNDPPEPEELIKALVVCSNVQYLLLTLFMLKNV